MWALPHVEVRESAASRIGPLLHGRLEPSVSSRSTLATNWYPNVRSLWRHHLAIPSWLRMPFMWTLTRAESVAWCVPKAEEMRYWLFLHCPGSRAKVASRRNRASLSTASTTPTRTQRVLSSRLNGMSAAGCRSVIGLTRARTARQSSRGSPEVSTAVAPAVRRISTSAASKSGTPTMIGPRNPAPLRPTTVPSVSVPSVARTASKAFSPSWTASQHASFRRARTPSSGSRQTATRSFRSANARLTDERLEAILRSRKSTRRAKPICPAAAHKSRGGDESPRLVGLREPMRLTSCRTCATACRRSPGQISTRVGAARRRCPDRSDRPNRQRGRSPSRALTASQRILPSSVAVGDSNARSRRPSQA